MAKANIFEKVEGYDEIIRDGAVLEKYGFDYQTRKGELRGIISMLHPEKLNLAVSEIATLTASTKSIKVVCEDGSLPPFQAGQYINIVIETGGIRTSRPYSIASSPTQTGYYEIAVRRVEDGFVSNYLLDCLKPGDRLESSSPAGNFHYNPLFHGSDLAFIAGGSGITPFMSMIRELADKNLNRRVHLLYGCRVEDDIIYRDELQRISEAHRNFTWDLVVSEPSPACIGLKGFIDASLIKETLQGPDWTYYICGPEAMYQFCLPQLVKLEIPARKTKVEVMGAPKRIDSYPGWPENVKAGDVFQVAIKGKKTISAIASEPLMISLERAGMTIPALCRSGECSLCRTKLLAGKVYQPSGVKLRKSDRAFGYIHPCTAYPLSDLEILI
ncbi:MAG: 2Fe-2S iron-sulfur cluster binding domain-containing protein [Deltaproteobacteria bacterium]|nr:2Fe-2S iron-sulfur cluster binding domain-containing protein [Deltaproteobacteria bacterium]